MAKDIIGLCNQISILNSVIKDNTKRINEIKTELDTLDEDILKYKRELGQCLEQIKGGMTIDDVNDYITE